MLALLLAVAEVLTGRLERSCKPGKWRVFRDDENRVVIERWTA